MEYCLIKRFGNSEREDIMQIRVIIGRILYNCLGRHLPLSDSRINLGSKKIRAICGKLILKECGRNVNIEKGATFATAVTLGDNSGIGVNSLISSEVQIGKNVMMGPECMMFTQNHAFQDLSIPMCQQGFSKRRQIIIEDDVWIGARVTILPGVKIGKGSIIGAGSVVTRDVLDYTIIAGNPAREIGKRCCKEEKNLK